MAARPGVRRVEEVRRRKRVLRLRLWGACSLRKGEPEIQTC